MSNEIDTSSSHNSSVNDFETPKMVNKALNVCWLCQWENESRSKLDRYTSWGEAIQLESDVDELITATTASFKFT